MSGATPGFATGQRKKSTNEASESVIRKIWMLIELLRHRRLAFELYAREHERDRRSFQRDLQQLRAIGKNSGFTISPLTNATHVVLESFDAKMNVLGRQGTATQQLIGDVARALGEPIAAEIGHVESDADGDADRERFFHFAVPRIIEAEGSNLAAITAELKAAWASRALVTFRYPEGRGPGGSSERLVEPYRVLLRSGVSYLVAYDRRRRGWRTFALDRFESLPVRAGSNNVARQMPAAYASADVLGFIKSDRSRTDVTVELSAFVAASAIGRQWQAAQRVELLDGGRARIVFTVSDISEVVRWTFGFGPDAKIVAPPQAVLLAAEMAQAIVAQHADVS